MMMMVMMMMVMMMVMMMMLVMLLLLMMTVTIMKMVMRNGSDQTRSVRAATLRQKLQNKVSIFPRHAIHTGWSICNFFVMLFFFFVCFVFPYLEPHCSPGKGGLMQIRPQLLQAPPRIHKGGHPL